MNKGTLLKKDNKWYVSRIEEGDWETYYPVDEYHNFWLQIWGEPGKQMNFIINDGKATLKPDNPDTHIYTQD